jgi:predicted nucleic acid-binding protein
MAVLEGEEGGETVMSLIEGGSDCALPFVVMMEVEYKLIAKRLAKVDDALSFVSDWPCTLVESDEPWRRIAAQVKAVGGLSFADSWVASLALVQDAVLVHKDPEFEKVRDLQHLKLPDKARRS